MSNRIVIDMNKIIKFAAILIAVFVLFFSIKSIRTFIGNNNFTKELIRISEQNKEPIFKISKIILYNSAYAIDNSDRNLLQDIDIHQYTDIAIYIDNFCVISDLNTKNTIKEMYIDNIAIDSVSEIGQKALNYKNPLQFGVFRQIYETEKIEFDIIKTNEKNTEDSYNNPVFFTDCSNPIPLGFSNSNILTNYNIDDEKKDVAFDGSLLEKANINMDDLQCRISFNLHIKNNIDEEYICNVVIDNVSGTNEIYNGYIAMEYSPSGITYSFFQLSV